jgi:outer membrane protein
MTRHNETRIRLLALAVVAGLALSACGDKEEDKTDEADATDPAATEADAPQSVRDVFANADIAQGPGPKAKLKVLVVNQRKILALSKAGEDVRKKLLVIEEAIAADQEAAMKTLFANAQELQQQRAILPPEQFRKKQQELSEQEQFISFKFQKELETVQALGERRLMARLNPIMQQIMIEQQGTVLFDRSLLMLSANEYDITDSAIEQLDAALPEVELERVLYEDLVKLVAEQEEKRKQDLAAQSAEGVADPAAE